METIPYHFFDEPIEVIFDSLPMLEKKPDCPQGFVWRDETYHITKVLEEWADFRRRGKMARNMKPAHITSAAQKGSWGVGRFCFRVQVDSGRIFELYYDRAPENVDNRKGNWFLQGERKPAVENNNLN